MQDMITHDNLLSQQTSASPVYFGFFGIQIHYAGRITPFLFDIKVYPPCACISVANGILFIGFLDLVATFAVLAYHHGFEQAHCFAS